MTLALEELVEASCDGLDVSRVEDEGGLLDAAKVAASGFGAQPAVLQAQCRRLGRDERLLKSFTPSFEGDARQSDQLRPP